MNWTSSKPCTTCGKSNSGVAWKCTNCGSLGCVKCVGSNTSKCNICQKVTKKIRV